MRYALSIAAFVAGLLLAIQGLRAWPEPKASTTDGALEYLAARGKNINVVVVGSSTVKVNFVTDIFTETMQKRGYDVHAFAFSMTSLQGPELDYYLERIMQLDLPKLKWVLVDVSLGQIRPLEKDNWYKRRVIEWHAPEQIGTLLRLIWKRDKGDFFHKAEQSWPHLAHAFLRYANVGVGVEAAKSGALWRSGKPEKIKPASAFSVGAFIERKQAARQERYNTKGLKAHQKAVKLLLSERAIPARKARLRVNDYPALFRDRVEQRGAKAALILSPVLANIRTEPKVKGKPDLRFLDLNDPRRFPELFNAELRYDRVHLAWQGAQLYTAALAERFADLLEAEGDESMRLRAESN